MIIFCSCVAPYGWPRVVNYILGSNYKAWRAVTTHSNRMKLINGWSDWELKMSTKMIILCSKSAPVCNSPILRLYMSTTLWSVIYRYIWLLLEFKDYNSSNFHNWALCVVKNGDHFLLLPSSQIFVSRYWNFQNGKRMEITNWIIDFKSRQKDLDFP